VKEEEEEVAGRDRRGGRSVGVLKEIKD